MITLSHTLRRETHGHDHILDLTDDPQSLVTESRIRCRQLSAMVPKPRGVGRFASHP